MITCRQCGEPLDHYGPSAFCTKCQPFPEWAMRAARIAVVTGPQPAVKWSSSSVPTNVLGEPRIYRIDTAKGVYEIDRWIVALAEKEGAANVIRLIAAELVAFSERLTTDA